MNNQNNDTCDFCEQLMYEEEIRFLPNGACVCEACLQEAMADAEDYYNENLR